MFASSMHYVPVPYTDQSPLVTQSNVMALEGYYTHPLESLCKNVVCSGLHGSQFLHYLM